jgi:hypothetical protein
MQQHEANGSAALMLGWQASAHPYCCNPLL